MSKRKTDKKHHWVSATSVRNASKRAPRRPGVYAIGAVKREAGLPAESRWIYVGRATGGAGLRGRLHQHEPVLERNPALRWWLADQHPDTEVWYTATGSADAAIALEKVLIRELGPEFNAIGRSRKELRSRGARKKGGDRSQ